jgi:hypothetical protein
MGEDARALEPVERHRGICERPYRPRPHAALRRAAFPGYVGPPAFETDRKGKRPKKSRLLDVAACVDGAGWLFHGAHLNNVRGLTNASQWNAD